MVLGPLGLTGLLAQSRVEAEVKIEQEHVQTPLLSMVVLTVLEIPLKLKPATHKFV